MPQERHPTLYFDDGDIVLSATTSGTGNKQLFRVHRLHLSHASDAVFRDMFVIATSSVDTGKYDGISLLPLPHDNSQDLESLLDVIYHPTHLLGRLTSYPKADTPLRLSGLACIARKYVVQDIAETIVKYIQGDWPENLESWDVYRDRLKVAANGEHYLWNDAVGDGPKPVSAILLALEHDNTAALYKLLITPLDAEWKEQQTVNADRTKWPPRFSSVWRRDLVCPSARWGLLDRRTLTAVLRLREEFHVRVGRTAVISSLPLFVALGRRKTQR